MQSNFCHLGGFFDKKSPVRETFHQKVPVGRLFGENFTYGYGKPFFVIKKCVFEK